MGEPLGVLGVDVGEEGHVGQEDVDLDDLLDAGAGSREDRLQVLDAGGRLLADGALDEVPLRVRGDLPRAVDGRRGLDGVRLHCARTERVKLVSCPQYHQSSWM